MEQMLVEHLLYRTRNTTKAIAACGGAQA